MKKYYASKAGKVAYVKVEAPTEVDKALFVQVAKELGDNEVVYVLLELIHQSINTGDDILLSLEDDAEFEKLLRSLLNGRVTAQKYSTPETTTDRVIQRVYTCGWELFLNEVKKNCGLPR